MWFGNGTGSDGREYRSLTPTAQFSHYPSDITITTDAVGLVVDVATVKQGLPDYGSDADNLITLMVGGVTDQIERYLTRDLLTKTRQAVYFNPANLVYLFPVPVASIVSVFSLDEEGTATAMTLNEDYYVRGIKDNIQLYNLNLNGGVALRVNYTTGYGTASQVPSAIRQAVLQETYRQFKRRADVDAGAMQTVDSLSSETMSLIRSYTKRFA